MKFEIKSWMTGAVIFTAEIECSEDTPLSIKIGLAVKAAVKVSANLSRADLSRADLSRANLIGANLRSFKADMWMTLTMNPTEVPGLINAIREGRVDGSQYQGDCACLVGTIANIKGIEYGNLDHNSGNPAERWFMMIRKGDKPGDETGGGFAAKMALEWALEWCSVSGVAVEV